MRISLIGAGNVEWHFEGLLGIDRGKFDKSLDGIAQALLGHEITLLPDRGVCFEVAKVFKKLGGGKVYGTVPLSDKDFGIEHLKDCMAAEIDVDGKKVKVFDEMIDTKDWYRENMQHCLFGDVVLMLGNSLGTMGELAYGFYLYKLFGGAKKEVEVSGKKLHPEIRAGAERDFSVICYEPFLKDKLGYEIEGHIKKAGGGVFYVNGAEELRQVLEKMGVLR